MKVEATIKIEVDKKIIELTYEEAKKLKQELEKYLSKEVVIQKEYIPSPYPVYPTYPRPMWSSTYTYEGVIPLTTSTDAVPLSIKGLTC